MSNYSEYYTTRKPTWWGERILTWWHKRMLQIAQHAIPHLNGKNILEIGTGHGFFAAICHQKKINYSGHEMNVEHANFLNAAGFNVTPATIPPIPSGNPVQVIWLSHILEHANTYSEAKQMLTACHDRLDTGGYLVIIAPDIHHWKSEFWSVDWSHGFPTSLNRVEQLLSETGFSLHKSMHHTFTVTNSFCAWLLSWFFRCTLPITFLDYLFKKFTGRTFGHSFMGVFGLRQIYLIGLKPSLNKNPI